jgi:hypothetical protein
MAKFLGISFSIIYLLTTTAFLEVLKLPIFIEHYAEYENDFIDYLVHHYGGHEKDADWETDQKLPFIEISPNLSVVFNIPETKKIEFPITVAIYKKKKTFLSNENHFISRYLSDIFQPPRSC